MLAHRQKKPLQNLLKPYSIKQYSLWHLFVKFNKNAELSLLKAASSASLVSPITVLTAAGWPHAGWVRGHECGWQIATSRCSLLVPARTTALLAYWMLIDGNKSKADRYKIGGRARWARASARFFLECRVWRGDKSSVSTASLYLSLSVLHSTPQHESCVYTHFSLIRFPLSSQFRFLSKFKSTVRVKESQCKNKWNISEKILTISISVNIFHALSDTKNTSSNDQRKNWKPVRVIDSFPKETS